MCYKQIKSLTVSKYFSQNFMNKQIYLTCTISRKTKNTSLRLRFKRAFTFLKNHINHKKTCDLGMKKSMTRAKIVHIQLKYIYSCVIARMILIFQETNLFL